MFLKTNAANRVKPTFHRTSCLSNDVCKEVVSEVFASGLPRLMALEEISNSLRSSKLPVSRHIILYRFCRKRRNVPFFLLHRQVPVYLADLTVAREIPTTFKDNAPALFAPSVYKILSVNRKNLRLTANLNVLSSAVLRAASFSSLSL